MCEHERRTLIWLEVSEIQYEAIGGAAKAGERKSKGPQATSPTLVCKVQLKADHAYPKPVWWPVAAHALGSKTELLDIYKQILSEMDKKRVVLAGLTWDEDGHELQVGAFRFQSADLGNRSI